MIIKQERYAQARTRDSHIKTSDQHKSTMCIKCRVTAWVTRGQKLEICGPFKAESKTVGSLTKDRVKSESRGGAQESRNTHKGYKELSFSMFLVT